jgi:hypothetical protein
MGWREDLAWKEFQKFQSFKAMKEAAKGMSKGKSGKGRDGKGKGKGDGGQVKVPCMDSRCKFVTNRNESHCASWWCSAPLNKDKKGGVDDALLAQAAAKPRGATEEDYEQPARVRKKTGKKRGRQRG